MSKRKTKVLFLCTGNSCRSQMAEGWANHLGHAWLEARSAGIAAQGQNPRAVAVMREAGVDISRQASKVVTPALVAWADLLITVCGHADEHCPITPPGTPKTHWPLSDPAKATGSEGAIMAVFRATREDIKARVQGLITQLKLKADGETSHARLS